MNMWNWIVGEQRWPNPCTMNGCAVVAMGHLGDLDEKGAQQLKVNAMRTPLVYDKSETLLSHKGTARGMLIEGNLQAWAKLAGVRVIKRVYTVSARRMRMRREHGMSMKGYARRTTVRTFAKTHKRGRYLIDVNKHVIALINGKLYGEYNLYQYVNSFVKVEKIK